MNSRIFKLKLFILHSVFPILLGGLIYCCFRSTSLRMFGWFSAIGLIDILKYVRESTDVFNAILPKWVIFSLPDGLWMYSFTSTLLIYWNNQNINYWLLIPFSAGIITEILQLFNIFPGTFDIIDLIFLTLGFTLSKVLINNIFKQYEKQLS